MLQSVFGAFTADLAVDIGTCNTRIFSPTRGVLLSEPTLVAMQEDRHSVAEVLAVGADAAEMEGRLPRDIRLVRPVQNGSVVDFDALEALMRVLMMQVQGRRLWVGPRVALAVPPGTVELERQGMCRRLEASGAREVHVIDQPIAVALGCGLPIDDACGHMVVDCGGGLTTVSVVSLGGVVRTRSLPVGGLEMDRAIVSYVRRQLGLEIGRATAEWLRIELGSVTMGTPLRVAVARGRRVDTGFPGEVEIDSDGIRIALQDPVHEIADAVLATLERTPPDLAADIAETGIVLTGGLAATLGLDEALGCASGLPVVVPDAPAETVVRGAAQSLTSTGRSRARA